jgi:hypothetical protein
VACPGSDHEGDAAIRFLPVLVELALVVFCVIDIIQTPPGAARNLEKGWWLVLVILIPIVGCGARLAAGRPTRESRSGWSQGAGFPEQARPVPDTTDIDRALQAELERVDREFEESLRHSAERARAREAELAAREQELAAREAELARREGPGEQGLAPGESPAPTR